MNNKVTSSRDDLLVKHRVAKTAGPPLIVVGLPRSGSSFLSHILSQISGWYVFDDLYLQDKAHGVGATGPLDDAGLDELLYFLGWQIRARLKFGSYAIPNVTEAEIEPMNEALKTAFSNEPGTWLDLQKEWLVRLAHRSDCANWGYKQPKAFRSVGSLRAAYPRAKFLWLMRHPHDVLASYKHMTASSQDGDPDQYHPVAHAIYWRMAAKSYFKAKQELGTMVDLVIFDDLVADPDATASRIAGLLEAERPNHVSIPSRPNSSFSDAEGRRGVSGLEAALINLICWPIASRMGFEKRSARLHLLDTLDITVRTFRFVRFRLLKNRGRWRS